MKQQRIIYKIAILSVGMLVTVVFLGAPHFQNQVNAEFTVVNSDVFVADPGGQDFDQAAALAKLREQISGKEREPAETVFKNIQSLKGVPAGRLLAIMEFGYSRSLGVNCTHCHTPEKWEDEGKGTKQIAREMAAMAAKINGELLKGIKNISPKSVINCTTCHRGQTTPATSLPTPVPTPAVNSDSSS